MKNEENRKECPETLPNPHLPSPTDNLPPELLEKIHDANELLLDLALSDDRSTNEVYQKVFDGLIGLSIEVPIRAGKSVVGRATLAGFDFVVLQAEEGTFIVPYVQIEKIKPAGRFAEPFPDPRLKDASPGCQQALTFRFGEMVASSPELIHLFFRIRLDVYLLTLESHALQVVTEDATFIGTLKQVDRETVCLSMKEKDIEIPIGAIYLIQV
ncbi:hypothetical protein M3193_07705 [Sporosarcina luteola]|uniref:hypothetical protein n=1 Tax=Sporosarcina luteola TaxID=582850 RepID=UPI00203DC912|nr:hypothetical protein [Sporosarcina luteola]MCM3744027.1 hypothetical protein [Sporosarcina luteola]